ncbi:MAG: hypothetical protein AB4426_06870 [Xenococcaceae cyanobacterium]
MDSKEWLIDGVISLANRFERLQAVEEFSDRLEFGDWNDNKYAEILQKLILRAAQE